MPWREVSVLGQRLELTALMQASGGASVKTLCQRFGVSRKTAYKWLRQTRAGDQKLEDRSRRPLRSPGRCGEEMELRVEALRREHPAWGAKKLRRYLMDQEGRTDVPAASTVGRILSRRGLIEDDAWKKHTAYLRFEYPEPNDLWQMDFKGPFPTVRQGKCHPLCVVDDHSRFALGVRACGNEEAKTVQTELIGLFRRYGMPAGMLADNGTSWRRHGWLSVWLIRLGVTLIHGRVRHPQTQGKLERFNRSLKAEALGSRSFGDLPACQDRFDAWREVYNCQRPHESLEMKVPVSRYRASERSYPESLPAIEYGPGDDVVTVLENGALAYAGGRWQVGLGYAGLPVAVRATLVEGVKGIFFCHQKVAEINLRAEPGVTPADPGVTPAEGSAVVMGDAVS